MTIKNIYYVILFFFPFSAAAQKEPLSKTKLIYIEFGGAAGYGSINYELLIREKRKMKLSTSFGFGTYKMTDFQNRFNPDIMIPISIKAYVGHNHHIEFTLGQVFSSVIIADNVSYNPTRKNGFSTSLSIGYRFQKEIPVTTYKVAYSPIIENNSILIHWFSIAIGKFIK